VPDENADVSLTVALAEYEAVREMRRGAHEGSAARFNYFLVVASGGTAVVAGLLGSAGAASAGRTAAALAIGAMVLLVGGVVFVRSVHYRVTGLEYNTALDAMRTYLVSRAPEVRPNVSAAVGRGTGSGWAAVGPALLVLVGAVAGHRAYERVVVLRALAVMHKRLTDRSAGGGEPPCRP
jgi:hypothetical protein